MPMQLLPPDQSIIGKTGFGFIGVIGGGIIGAASGGWLLAIAAAISSGLVGVIGGAFFDGDYHHVVYLTTPKKERAWTVVGYTILFGLAVAVFGIMLSFFVPDWRPFLLAAGGMLCVVVALSYGEMVLAK